eukprot:8973-Alexandrium_andersonii.AAC.1
MAMAMSTRGPFAHESWEKLLRKNGRESSGEVARACVIQFKAGYPAGTNAYGGAYGTNALR